VSESQGHVSRRYFLKACLCWGYQWAFRFLRSGVVASCVCPCAMCVVRAPVCEPVCAFVCAFVCAALCVPLGSCTSVCVPSGCASRSVFVPLCVPVRLTA
jgi:hypothetical protein